MRSGKLVALTSGQPLAQPNGDEQQLQSHPKVLADSSHVLDCPSVLQLRWTRQLANLALSCTHSLAHSPDENMSACLSIQKTPDLSFLSLSAIRKDSERSNNFFQTTWQGKKHRTDKRSRGDTNMTSASFKRCRIAQLSANDL